MLPYTRPESGQAPQEKPLRGISPWAAIVQRSPKQEATASYGPHSTMASESCQIGSARGCGKTGSLLGSYFWLARGLAFTWVFVLPIGQCGTSRVAEGNPSRCVSAW